MMMNDDVSVLIFWKWEEMWAADTREHVGKGGRWAHVSVMVQEGQSWLLEITKNIISIYAGCGQRSIGGGEEVSVV